jgi:hypothetical protein
MPHALKHDVGGNGLRKIIVFVAVPTIDVAAANRHDVGLHDMIGAG